MSEADKSDRLVGPEGRAYLEALYNLAGVDGSVKKRLEFISDRGEIQASGNTDEEKLWMIELTHVLHIKDGNLYGRF